jgi:hypothetical protein
MSDHYHLVISVPHENVSKLMQVMNETLAKAIKVLRRHGRGVVFEPGGLSLTELHGAEAVVYEIAYCIVNPVKAGLVYRPGDWPGVITLLEDLGRKTLGAPRPGFYFTDTGPWGACASTTLTLPEWLIEHYGSEERLRAEIAAEVERQMKEARAEVKDNRWSVMGATAVKNVSPYKRARSYEKFGGRRPCVATGPGQTELRKVSTAS